MLAGKRFTNSCARPEVYVAVVLWSWNMILSDTSTNKVCRWGYAAFRLSSTNSIFPFENKKKHQINTVKTFAPSIMKDCTTVSASHF